MIISSRKGGDCMDIKERVFLELSLLSYFPYPYIGCSVSEMIEWIIQTLNEKNIEEIKRWQKGLMMIVMIRYIYMML